MAPVSSGSGFLASVTTRRLVSSIHGCACGVAGGISICLASSTVPFHHVLTKDPSDGVDLDLHEVSAPAWFYRGLEDDLVARIEHLATKCRCGARRALVLDAGEDLGEPVRDLDRRFRIDERAAAHHRGVPQVIHGNRACAVAQWVRRRIWIGQVGPGHRSGGDLCQRRLLVRRVENAGGSERKRGEIDVLPPRDVLGRVEIGIVGAGLRTARRS